MLCAAMGFGYIEIGTVEPGHSQVTITTYVFVYRKGAGHFINRMGL